MVDRRLTVIETPIWTEVEPLPGTAKLMRINTDRLGRDPEAQIRVTTDWGLVGEYAQAMLSGVQFPPPVVFDDGDGYCIGDGYHRVEATAVAHAKLKTFKNEILCEVRQGTFEDALRYAMQANNAHGKRLTEDDYGHAIRLALKHGLIGEKQANMVAAAIMVLIPGVSRRRAQECSKDYRAALVAKRDRLILKLYNVDGETQQAIANAVGVPQQTVSDVIRRATGKRDAAQSGKPKPKLPVMPEAPEPEEARDPRQGQRRPDPTSQPEGRYSYAKNPLLGQLELPTDKVDDDEDSGIVTDLSEPEPEVDPKAVDCLTRIDAVAEAVLADLEDLKDLEGYFPADIADPIAERLERVSEYLQSISDYLTARGRQ